MLLLFLSVSVLLFLTLCNKIKSIKKHKSRNKKIKNKKTVKNVKQLLVISY